MTKDESQDLSQMFQTKYEKRDPYSPPVDAIDVTPNKDGGVLKQIKTPGCGTSTPANQNRVQVHYVGYFPDGTVFDSSREGISKFEFTIGRDVIKAWDWGVMSMLRGEVAILYCKPEYAYGATGHPPRIPPNATLVFEIELFDWKGEDLSDNNDEGIIRYQLVKGAGYTSPKVGALVEIHLTGRHEDRVFDERDVSFVLGEGEELGIPEGVEKGLEKFTKGETSNLTLRPKYAFGKDGNPNFSIPPEASLTYEVTLKNFEKKKDIWSMDTKEKIEQATISKNRGTEFFKSGKYKMALKHYLKIVDYLQSEKNLADKEMERECQQILLAAYLNMAMCYLKTKEYVEAKESCEKALEIDNQNEKGLFRRGQAYQFMNDYDLALKDFNAVLKVDPNNKAAKNQIIVCNSSIKQHREQEKKTYGNMFARFAAQDETREQKLRSQSDVLQNPGTWPTAEQPKEDENTMTKMDVNCESFELHEKDIQNMVKNFSEDD